jgi:hypothetical protein
MNNDNTNISSRLDTLADILDHDIKWYHKVADKAVDLRDASNVILRHLGRENPAFVAVEQEIMTLNTEEEYWSNRNDDNVVRYWELVEEYEEQYEENYIPERGANWKPAWATSVEYDDREPNWDMVTRHDSNEGW